MAPMAAAFFHEDSTKTPGAAFVEPEDPEEDEVEEIAEEPDLEAEDEPEAADLPEAAAPEAEAATWAIAPEVALEMAEAAEPAKLEVRSPKTDVTPFLAALARSPAPEVAFSAPATAPEVALSAPATAAEVMVAAIPVIAEAPLPAAAVTALISEPKSLLTTNLIALTPDMIKRWLLDEKMTRGGTVPYNTVSQVLCTVPKINSMLAGPFCKRGNGRKGFHTPFCQECGWLAIVTGSNTKNSTIDVHLHSPCVSVLETEEVWRASIFSQNGKEGSPGPLTCKGIPNT